MRVKNRNLIRTLTFKMLKAGKTRNVVVIIAIALTATLFTTLFAIGGNMLTALQNATMRQVGTSSHGGLKYLTQAQYDNFTQSPLIKDISYNIIIAVAENEALQKKQTEIRYSEDKCAEWGFSYPTTGDMPRAGKELACSTITLDMLGIPHVLGQTVPLEFTIHGKRYAESFTLVGFWPGDDVMAAVQIWLSREFTDSVVTVPEEVSTSAGFDGIAGAIMADVWFSNAVDIEGKMERLVAERGYAPGEIHTGINWAYASGQFDMTTMMLVAVVVLIILFSGYLIIYSVFALSVASDIKFYGLLKTIGATGTQLRRIVRGQALALSLIGIPLGFALGYMLGYGLTPALMSVTNLAGTAATTANPLIFLFSGVFSLVTVFISCRKPGRIAAKVSPVEAVRYTETAVGSKKREKRTRKVSPVSMAFANIFRRKSKLVIVTLSLSLSVILLGSVYSMVRGFDMERYLENQMISDFSVADYSVYSPLTASDNYEGVDPGVLSGIAAFEGLEDEASIYFYDDYLHTLSPKAHENMKTALDFLTPRIERYWPHSMEQVRRTAETGIAPLHVYGLGKMAAERLDLSRFVDYAKLSEGDYVFVSHVSADYDREAKPVYEVGDQMPLINQNGQLRTFEVLAVLDSYPYSISAQHSHIIDSEIVMADSVFLDFYGDKQPMMTIFNAADEHIPAMTQWLENYCKTVNTNLDYRSLDYYKGEFENMRRTFVLLGGTLAFILALIGVLNFINAIITSITARRREFAMLQSVGMTGRQLKQMLFSEGAAYALLTVFLSLTLGSLLSRLIVQVIAGQLWFFTWRFTILPQIIAAPMLLLLCALIPILCYRVMRRESVVERLRDE